MKMISWNVNGLRAVVKKGFYDFVVKQDPNILCLQETKLQEGQLELELPQYHCFWNYAEKKGYSGTLILTKRRPVAVQYDLGKKEHDREGRVITLEFPSYYLVNVYTPNSQRGLLRLDYRQKWDRYFLQYLKNLEESKPVIFCGDLNVAHQEIDLKNPDSNHNNAGFTNEERAGFDNIIAAGFIDSFREFVTEGGHYTWWSYMNNARKRNIGWRIDYFCISQSLRRRLKTAFILPDVMGSDHCPVGIELR